MEFPTCYLLIYILIVYFIILFKDNEDILTTTFNTDIFTTTFNSDTQYSFVDVKLKSGFDLSEIVSEINTLLPQLSDFINQFNDMVNKSGISVVTDSSGNMSIDVPNNMPDSEANKISTRIGIIDRLITTRGQEIDELLQKGVDLEKDIKKNNPDYKSQLIKEIEFFKKLNDSYKH